jgi:hypothetical protein
MEKISEKEIWVYVDLRNKRLFDLSLNVLAKAREIAELVSGKTREAVVNPLTQAVNKGIVLELTRVED